MKEGGRTAKIISKFGTRVDVEWDDNGHIRATVFIDGACVTSEDIGDNDLVLLVEAFIPFSTLIDSDVRDLVSTTILPFVFDLYISDPYLRIRLFYEFDIIEVVNNEQDISEGDYYIAVERLYDSGLAKLELIGCCPDGSSYFTPESALKAYQLLECHSCDSDGLPILGANQISPNKCVLFRLD